MALTQDVITSFLVERGGKAKNSDLLKTFNDLLNCSDPEEKKRNRDLFKKFVNNIAVVREIDDVKYVVLKKKNLYGGKLAVTAQQPDLGEKQTGVRSAGSEVEHKGHDRKDGKILRSQLEHSTLSLPSASNENLMNVSYTSTPRLVDAPQTRRAGEVTYASNPGSPVVRSQKHDESPKVEDLNLPGEARTRKTGSPYTVVDVKPQPDKLNAERRVMHLKVDGPSTATPLTEAQKPGPKPCALPLRMPPPEIKVESVDSDAAKSDSGTSVPELSIERSPRFKRRQQGGGSVPGSPQVRRTCKTPKPGDEVHFPECIPLEPAEHEWMVRCAAGHWSHVHGLLLQDTHLAKKRDFISGLTALHWAAKSDNHEMLSKIIEIAKRGGMEVDINAKTHGGYTPLHVAAIHDRRATMAMLVQEFGANVHLRDNSGKKPYHYLHQGAPSELRALLGAPQVLSKEVSQEKLDNYAFPDHQKGFNTLSRIFQPHVAHKKKYKSRPSFSALSGVAEEENGAKQRPSSDMFH
ncbi:ankyrin repeat domain-containing protein SOWAHA [Brienomyrus brachyistius]|uniref:ankyrin repeat domain-containing protein SOWAHA n=1 Tax=Brienomyrus brachyistius TaxID=42636 RepID=UPI0020B38283|nr:ankyrin repeat domain-containing protein SOWAHA [Brienomyrus brachyistius]